MKTLPFALSLSMLFSSLHVRHSREGGNPVVIRKAERPASAVLDSRLRGNDGMHTGTYAEKHES